MEQSGVSGFLSYDSRAALSHDYIQLLNNIKILFELISFSTKSLIFLWKLQTLFQILFFRQEMDPAGFQVYSKIFFGKNTFGLRDFRYHILCDLIDS